MKRAELLADRLIEQLYMNPDLRVELVVVCETEETGAITDFIIGLFKEQLDTALDD